MAYGRIQKGKAAPGVGILLRSGESALRVTHGPDQHVLCAEDPPYPNDVIAEVRVMPGDMPKALDVV